MDIILIRDDRQELSLDNGVWGAVLNLAAERCGWLPAGTEEPKFGAWHKHRLFSEEFDGEPVVWDGGYLDAWGQHVTPEDARSLADSVSWLLEDLQSLPAAARSAQVNPRPPPTEWDLLSGTSQRQVRNLGLFAAGGGFLIHQAKERAIERAHEED